MKIFLVSYNSIILEAFKSREGAEKKLIEHINEIYGYSLNNIKELNDLMKDDGVFEIYMYHHKPDIIEVELK